MRLLILPALAFSALTFVGCRAPALPSPTVATGPAPILPYLATAEYPLELSPTGTIRLANGIFEGQAAQGSATRLTVRLGDMTATGDLNGDRIDDAAVMLLADPGGSGTFIYIAAVLNDGGVPHAVASALLGDRLDVKSLSIRQGTIVVEFLERAPGEPLTSPPTVETSRLFRLQDGLLEQEP